MRIELHAGWRRALLLLAILPSLTSAQAGYDFETQPINPSFSPRGYQPPPQPARYPVPAPAPRFPHQSVGYQPPPQPALYESTAEYRQPSRPVYRPHLPHRPAPESTYEATPVQHRPHRPQYETAPERPAYHPEPEEQPSYGATPVQPMYPREPPPIPPHRPSTAHPYTYGPEPARPSYESTPRQPMRAASMMPPAPHRPAPVYDLEPARPSPSPRPTQRPAPAYESVPDHPAPAYHPEPSRPAPSPRPTQRPAHAYHPEPARPSPSPRPTERPAPAYHPEPENPYESVPAPTPHRPSPSHRPEPANPYEPEKNPYEPAPHHPVQRPGQTRQPPAIAPSGTFGPAPGSENSEGEGLNVMIHVFINEKQPAGVTTEAPGPMAPPQPLPPQLAGMHFPHSSMPLTFTRDFDRTKNRFLMDEEEDNQEGPANIVEIKAVVDSSDAAMDMRIGKAMAKELDRAVPAILGKIADKTSRLDEELRNMLEQELISEISKNLGAHLEQSTDVSEKELSDLIDEGLKELEPDTTPSRPHFTAPPSSPATSRPAATSKPATQPPTRPTEATRPSEHPAPHTTESDQPTRPTETARPPASHTTAQPVPPTRPAAPATEVTRPNSPPAVTSQPAQPPATTASATRPSEPPATSSSPAASPATSTAAETHRPDTVATSRPVQQQQSTAAAPSPATVQWWTPTTAAPPAADAAEPQHPTAATTAAPLPPVATMRTFPTETLPLPVTQPTLKVPESEEEKSEDVDEMPFHHKGDEFPTEQPNATEKPKEEEKAPTSECSVARDASDTTKADVLFLLDSSTVFNESNFKGALELITNTTSHFKNIGPDGIQVSLIQFADEPQLEFSLRRHNCLPTLIEDIKRTEYLKGKSLLGHAIDKATRLAFTRERGDRPDAENVLIVVTDGVSEDKVHLPVTVAKENGVSVLVISTIEADPEIVLELAGTAENVFKMDGKITEPLSTRLAQRIHDTASGYHIPEQRFPPDVHESKDESAEEKKKEEEKGGEKAKDESTTPLPSTLMSGEATQEMLPPPKNLKLACTRKSLGINIELPGAFHGWLFIEGQRENKNCSMKVEKEEGVPFRHVHFEAGIEECDIAHIVSESPAGVNSSAVVSIVKHPKAVSIDDKAYLLECFVASALETTLDAHLEVVGGIKKTIAEAFSLDVVPPKCHYTIRKGSPEGLEVEKADLGEVVFHRWDCDGGDEAYDVFGMHIHDCYASSDVEQQFPILDKNGCSSNLNLLNTPVYAEGALSVYAESRAFAVENDQQDLKFQCKVSLCTRDGDGCEGITPPRCSGNNATDLLVSRRLRHNQAVDSALTSAVATSVGLTTAAVSRYSPGLVVLIAIILAVAIGLISAVRLKSCRTRRSCSRPIVTSPSMEEIYVTVPGARPPIRTPGAPNPAMTDFMKNFDRSRYV